jgi:hypothetical protein
MSEWLKETGCKLVGVSLRWFESSSAHIFFSLEKGVCYVNIRRRRILELKRNNGELLAHVA